MSTVSLRMPDYLHNRLKEISAEEHTSINQLINLSIAEKVSALETMDYLTRRAKRGSREKFNKVMALVPDVEPEKYDKVKGLQKT